MRRGERIKPIPPGKIMGRVTANKLGSLAGALTNSVIQISKTGTSPQVHIGDERIIFEIPAGGTGGTGTATNGYQGVYVAGQSYNAFEWVVVQAGPGQGAYISLVDANTNSPLTGINWVQFSSLNQWF